VPSARELIAAPVLKGINEGERESLAMALQEELPSVRHQLLGCVHPIQGSPIVEALCASTSPSVRSTSPVGTQRAEAQHAPPAARLPRADLNEVLQFASRENRRLTAPLLTAKAQQSLTTALLSKGAMGIGVVSTSGAHTGGEASASSALGKRARQYEQYVSDARTAARHFGHFLPEPTATIRRPCCS
jgi:hypothetical protein